MVKILGKLQLDLKKKKQYIPSYIKMLISDPFLIPTNSEMVGVVTP